MVSLQEGNRLEAIITKVIYLTEVMQATLVSTVLAALVASLANLRGIIHPEATT